MSSDYDCYIIHTWNSTTVKSFIYYWNVRILFEIRRLHCEQTNSSQIFPEEDVQLIQQIFISKAKYVICRLNWMFNFNCTEWISKYLHSNLLFIYVWRKVTLLANVHISYLFLLKALHCGQYSVSTYRYKRNAFILLSLTYKMENQCRQGRQ